MAIQHLLEPKSKLSTHTHQNRYLGLPEIKLQHLYCSFQYTGRCSLLIDREGRPPLTPLREKP